MSGSNHFEPFYRFPVFTPEECLEIIQAAETRGFETKTLVDDNTGVTTQLVSVMVKDGPLFDLVADRLNAKAAEINPYDFELFDHPVRQIFVIKYGVGSSLAEHVDYNGIDGCHTRKLNTTTALNDGFEGGLLTLSDTNDHPLQHAPIGTTAVYPGYAAHSVTPITSGVRYSLAAWLHGPSFR